MIQLKIPQVLYHNIILDLKRPHETAIERIGFLFVKKGMEGSQVSHIFAVSYIPVEDNDYIFDEDVGAKINSNAIRAILQEILNTGLGVLHVHMHSHFGQPEFSRVDINNLPKLIPSFQAICPTYPHGALLLSKNSMISLMWLPGGKTPEYVDKITVVGYPLGIYRRWV